MSRVIQVTGPQINAPARMGTNGTINVRANPGDWGQAGQTLANVGAGAMQGGQRIMERENQLLFEKRSLELENYFSDTLDPVENEKLSEWRKLSGKAAHGATETAKEWYKEQEEQLKKQTASAGPLIQRRAQEKFNTRKSAALKTVALHEAGQLDVWKRNSLKASGDAGLNAIVSRPADPSVLFGQIREFQNLALETLPETEVDQAVGTYRNKAVTAAVYSLLDSDPYKAEELLAGMTVSDAEGNEQSLISADTRLRLNNDIERAVDAHERRIELAAKEEQRRREEYESDRASVLVTDLEDSLSSTLNTGKGNPQTGAMIAELYSLGERGAKLADKYDATFNRINNAWATVEENKSKPFTEQFAAVEKLKPEPGSKGYKANFEVYERTRNILNARYNAFTKDPAAFVQNEAAQRLMAVGKNPDQDLPQLIQTSLEIQKKYGIERPQIMSKSARQSMRTNYEQADARGKIAAIRQLDDFGEYKNEVLAELKLGYEHTYAASLYNDNPELSQKVILALETKAGDIGISPDEAKALKAEASRNFYDSGFAQVLIEQGRLTGNPQYQQMAAQLENMAVKMALFEGDAAKSSEELFERYNVIADPDIGYVSLPGDVDESRFESGLERTRKELKPKNFDNANKEFILESVWMNSPDGKGVCLVHPLTGAALFKDGKLWTASTQGIVDSLQFSTDQYGSSHDPFEYDLLE